MSDSALPIAQARALSAPARRAIIDFLADHDDPATVTQLTCHLGLNHNAVRKHLAVLVAADLVTEERETRSRPGRPNLLYRLMPGSQAVADQPYRRLAVMLASALASGEDPETIGRNARTTCPTAGPQQSPVDAMAERFSSEGFEPRVQRRGRRPEIVLQRCPFADAAEVNPDGVCRLHRGLADGAAEAIGGIHVESLIPKNPRVAGCRLLLTTTAPAFGVTRPDSRFRPDG
jgi:predicted ArsR family transcriptional regulator